VPKLGTYDNDLSTTMYLIHLLVLSLHCQGRLQEAEAWVCRLIKDLEQSPYLTQRETLEFKVDVACHRMVQGHWGEAEALVLEVIVQCRHGLGLECNTMGHALSALGEIYSSQGRWKEASLSLDSALRTTRKLRGDTHYRVLECLLSQVILHVEQGLWGEAEALDLQCREVAADLPLFRLMTTSLYRAAIFDGQGKFEEARELGEQAVKYLESTICPEYIHLPRGKNILVQILRNLGELAESEKLGIQTVELSTKIFGSLHPTTMRCADNLARTWMAQGRSEKAIQAMEECVGPLISTIGHDHYLTQRSWSTLQQWRGLHAQEVQPIHR